MPPWSSHAATPPSLVYPPDGAKWHSRTGLPGTINAVALNGAPVCIGELRGWLRYVAESCNSVDPDWHYWLELDASWLDTLGIGLEQYLSPGDVINAGSAVSQEIIGRSSSRARYEEPIIEIELDGWQRTDPYRGQPPLPADWIITNDCNGGNTVWPYDPLHPGGSSAALKVGDYVRVVGSLVSDEPHMMQDQIATNYVLRFGYGSAVQVLGQERADNGALAAVKWLWGGNLHSDDAAHPARWNEIHSPDFFEVMQPPDRNEIVRCIAVVAQNGTFSGDIEEITAEIPLPGRTSRWHTIGVQKTIGPATIFSTILRDEVSIAHHRVRVHVRVQGQGGLGANGKFVAFYRVRWVGISPRIESAAGATESLLTGSDANGEIVVRRAGGWPPHMQGAWNGVNGGTTLPGGNVGAVSRSANHLDIFVCGDDNQVYTAAAAGGPWAGWWAIPGLRVVRGAPINAVSRNLDKLDIFLSDENGRVMSASWEPAFTGWQGWWHVQGGMTAPGGDVAAVCRRPDYLDIFVAGTDGQVWTAAWEPSGAGWRGWWPIGARLSPGSPVSCVSRSLDKLDIFIADEYGRVMSAAWEPGFTEWHGWWHILGGTTKPGGTVAAVSRRPDHLDLFIVGTDGQIWTAAWEPAFGWRGWWSLPGIQCHVGTPLTAFSSQPDVLTVVTSNTGGDIVANSWSPQTTWTGWNRIN